MRRLLVDERGNSLALVAIALPMLFGGVGLAVDTAHWVMLKRQLQQVADSAAMSGSYTAIQGGDVDFAVDADTARRRGEIGNFSTRAKLSPEGHDGDPFAVAVTVSAPAGLSFASMFMSKPLMVTASATATMVETADFCAFALDGGAETGITIAPNSSIESECGIATNSSATDAFRGDSSSSIAAKKLFAYGGIVGGTQEGTRTRAYALKQKDPVADIAPPIPPTEEGCPNITINEGEHDGLTLQPGCFGNLALNGKVTLAPGAYVLNRGNLVFGPKAEISCNGCTLFLTSDNADNAPGSIGRAHIDSAATVTMSAPTDGPYAGLLLYQDRRAKPEEKGEENVIAGGSQSKLDGIIYFPSQGLRIDGTASPNLRCARMIGRRLILQGHLVIAKGCSADGGKVRMTGAEVKLVA